MKKITGLLTIALTLGLCLPAQAAKFNAFGTKTYTIESEHFRLHYREGLHDVAKRVGDILEGLYDTYRNTYHLTLPDKTEVLVSDDDYSGGWALSALNMIHIWANDFDYNLRGTSDNIENVIAHEYAHIVSIWSSFKLPSFIPYMQFGVFTHPNKIIRGGDGDSDSSAVGLKLEAFHIFPSEILPPWFFEGIAQFESSRNNGDRWDTHRDMILRTLSVSDKMLSWDHMSVFAGKEEDFEKTYSHGFALTRYIAENYGYEKVVSILRESTKLPRVNFDRSIKNVLGISGRQLYKDWTRSLKVHYTKQLESIGTQVYGRKIDKAGFDNMWPKFGPKDERIFFISNGEKDYAYSYKDLYSYDLSDTVEDDKRIKMVSPKVKKFYDISDSSGLIIYSSMHSRKSILPADKGGIRLRDIFVDSIPNPDKKKKPFAKKTERQLTEKASAFHGVLSPSGDKVAFSKHVKDKFYLCIADTSGENVKYAYPPKRDSLLIRTIYSVDWSPDGQNIAISYMDKTDRKIGVYDTTSGQFHVFCDTEHDERDPRFGPDGKRIYFSSDRTGIFNIYRYDFETSKLQMLTNVSGGAFTPDVSNDESKLVYANYDTTGYSIYLIDTLAALEEKDIAIENAYPVRGAVHPHRVTADFTPERTYNKMPRQFMFVPTFFVEQILSDDDDVFTGMTSSKIGGVAILNDPLDWADIGSTVGGYFLIQPGRLHKLFSALWNSEDGFRAVNREIDYDLGVFGSTRLLPLDISAIYAQRAIAGRDYFIHDYYGEPVAELQRYNLNPHIAELSIGYSPNRAVGFNVFGSLNRYQVFVSIGDYWFPYSPARGGRLGAFATFRSRAIDSKMNISPKGLYAKLKYEYWQQRLQNEDKLFTFEDGKISEVYDPYRYHQLTASIRYGRVTPWYKKHDLYVQLEATGLELTRWSKDSLARSIQEGETVRKTELPSFFQPGGWLPGYAYYFRDTTDVRIRGKNASGADTIYTEQLPKDTLLLSGNGLFTGSISYRFPLFPGSIDKKLGFLYFDRLYGAFNVGGGMAKNDLWDFVEPFKKNDLRETLHQLRSDFLLYYGAEIRLEALSFNTYPLAVILRWDYGADMPAPVGGHKFSVNIGFSFDNWELILEPDGTRAPRVPGPVGR